MAYMGQLSRTLGMTLGVTAGLAGVGAMVALRRPIPRTNGTLTLPGLRHTVRIHRDRWAIPHMYAESNEDLFAALGYTHAQDRLWQMELNRRTGFGMLAEIFGPIAVSSDRFVRVLGFGRMAHRDVGMLDDETRTLVEAYLRGVNGFIETHATRLPVEFTVLRFAPRPWEAADIVVWSKVMALNLSENWMLELLNARIAAKLGNERARELIPHYPPDGPVVVPQGIHYNPELGQASFQAIENAAPFLGIPGDQGSNAWVVAGQRSTSGRPLLANDPHLNVSIPSIWYEAHLEGGDFAVAGVTMPGTLGVVIGHNARIAWGVTNGMTDVQDLYIEQIHPDDPLRYACKGEWERVEVVREELKVKGQASPEVVEVRLTRHGPIIDDIATPPQTPLTPKVNGRPREALAIRWTALEPLPPLQRALLDLNRARNWGEFRSAIAGWTVPAQNFVYADVEGNIGYALGGWVPIRVQGDGNFPVPGWSGEYEWQGYIPPDQLPATLNPTEGFAVTANNRNAGDGYHYHHPLHAAWLNGYRAARIRTMIEQTPQHDPQSFTQMHQDLLSLPGLQIAHLVGQLYCTDVIEQQAQGLLHSWDGILNAESVAGTIYDGMRYHLLREVYREIEEVHRAPAALGAFASIPAYSYLDRALPMVLSRATKGIVHDTPDPWLGNGRTWRNVLAKSFTATIKDLRHTLGNDPRTWRYGRIHSLTLRHPLGSVPGLTQLFNRGTWPTGGDIDTVSQAYTPRDLVAGPIYVAPSVRMICDVGNWDNSQSVYPGGQSGHPGSRHYNELSAAWLGGTYHPMFWKRTTVERETSAVLVLEAESGEHERRT